MLKVVRLAPAVLLGLMTVIGLSAAGAHLAGLGAPAASSRRELFAIGVLLGMPALMLTAYLFARRHVYGSSPRLAHDHRRYLEVSLAATFLAATGIEVWQAISLLTGPFDSRLIIRWFGVWFGISLIIRGNFLAKAGPPSGERAPDPALYLRSARRTGWLLALIGSGLLLCAVVAPLKLLALALLMAALLLVAVVRLQRQGEGGPAPRSDHG